LSQKESWSDRVARWKTGLLGKTFKQRLDELVPENCAKKKQKKAVVLKQLKKGF
jgi:hypothetical protein